MRTSLVGIIAAIAGVASAQPRYIGTASCTGNFWVDSAGVSQHATLFESSSVETEVDVARLQLGNVRVMLDAHSRAKVDAKRLVLEKGRAQQDGGQDYAIETRGIRVSPAKPGARAIVSLGAAGEVEVAALGGTVHVANAEGVVVANVAAGRAVELRLAPTSDAAILTGCLVKNGSVYTLRDEASAVTVELRGADVASSAGQRVQVHGTMAPTQHALAAADQVVQAKALRLLGASCGTATQELAAVTGSRARAAAPENAAAPAASGSPDADPGVAGNAGGGAGGSAASGGIGSTAGAAGGAAASSGIGISTAVIAGVAVAAGAGTAAAIVATQAHKAPISPGR